MYVPGLRCLAVNEIGLGTAGKLREHRYCSPPLLGNDLTHWETVAGIINRRLQYLRKGQLAMPPLHLHKGIDGPRHRHRAPTLPWDTLDALTSQGVKRKVLGAAATAIDPIDLAVCGPVVQQKGIAANTRRH